MRNPHSSLITRKPMYHPRYMNAAPTEGGSMGTESTTTRAARDLQRGDLLLCNEEFTDRRIFREVFEVEQDRDGDRIKVRVSDRDTPSLPLWFTRDQVMTCRTAAEVAHFGLRIEMGNAAMLTFKDVADEVRTVLTQIEEEHDADCKVNGGTITDRNGNSVGTFTLILPEPETLYIVRNVNSD